MMGYAKNVSRTLIGMACLAASATQAVPITKNYLLAPVFQVIDGQDANLSVNVSDIGALRGVVVYLTFTKCGTPATGGPAMSLVSGQYVCADNALNSHPEDIDIGLIGPNSTPIRLVIGDDGSSFPTYPFDSSNPAKGKRIELTLTNDAVDIIGGANGFASGSFLPENALPDSGDVNGTWTLVVADILQNDPLGIESASLDLRFEPRIPGTQVPEPATLALLGLGLIGLGALKRRR